jgi:hypothetical protein
VLKRRSIDKYIQQVTAGLPHLERVDTAAELRVHLLQKTRELMAQGFPREEAEHLAVQEMGPVAETNRALLGHIFTSSLGWWALGLLLCTGAVWTFLKRDAIFWKDTSITNRKLDTQDLEFAIRQTPSFAKPPKLIGTAFYLPRGTRILEYAIITKRGHYQSTVLHDTLSDIINREPHRFSMLIGEGPMANKSVPNARGIVFQTSIVSDETTRFYWLYGFTAAYNRYNRNGFGRIWTQQKIPNTLTDLTTWNPVKLNKWTPMYLLSPSKQNGDFVYPDPKAAEALLIAVRASDGPESALKATKLQFSSSTDIDLHETKIEVSETPLNTYRDPFAFHTGDPKVGVSFPINEVR